MKETISEATKHTPGPWVVDGGGSVSSKDYECPVATVSRGMRGNPWVTATRMANARLIAAAPELLEACHDAIVGLSAMLDDNETAAERLAAESLALLAIESAEAAIEKAQGK